MEQDFIIKETANKIATARRLRAYSQKLLASKLNLEQAAVSNMESGRRNMQLQTLQRIADALDMELRIEFVPKETLQQEALSGDVSTNEFQKE